MDQLIVYQKKINMAHENYKWAPFFYGYADSIIETSYYIENYHRVLSQMVMEWYPKFWYRHVIDDLNLRPNSIYLQNLVNNWS